MADDHVRYARFPPEVSTVALAPVLIGLERGYFRRQGIDLEVVLPEQSSWLAVSSGAADVGALHFSFCAMPELRGTMKTILVHDRQTEGHGFTGLMARPGAIEDGVLTDDPRSLKGARIGLLSGRGDDFLAYYWPIHNAGLSMRDVKVRKVGHWGPTRDRALADGTVDLVLGRAPMQRRLETAAGAVQLWKMGCDVAPNRMAQYLVGNNEFLSERPKVATRFLIAYLRGARDYRRAYDDGFERSAIIDLLASVAPDSKADLRRQHPAGFCPNGRIDVDQLREDIGALVHGRVLPELVDPTAVADNRFVDGALDALGCW